MSPEYMAWVAAKEKRAVTLSVGLAVIESLKVEMLQSCLAEKVAWGMMSKQERATLKDARYKQ